MLYFIGYIATIFGANWAITTFGFVPVGFGLAAPAGVYFAGAAFTLRDGLQESKGKTWVLAGIILGAVASAWVSPQFAFASGVAFLVSELADFAVYTPVRKRNKVLAMILSNTVGLIADSILFLVLAFGSLQYLPGQIVGKAWITLVSVLIVLLYQRRIIYAK